MGSNMAEQHPVGFQWVIEAKERGATVMHADPRYTRTSAMADVHVPLRAGTDIAFLGGIINYILAGKREFSEYVRHYTNARVIIKDEFRDVDELDGLFSGWVPQDGVYNVASWGYTGTRSELPAGKRERRGEVSGDRAHGAHGMTLEHGEPPEEDPTLEHPKCVFQILKRHFARYTPEVVEEICGVPRERLLQVAETLCRNSGRERTSAICYAVGWTQHTHGVQNIRAAAIIQLLLGNIGRPGGGILALRGHANIQGSTDIPTLFDILPGYIPMPHPDVDDDLDGFVERNAPDTGVWGSLKSYTVSLLKAWWGEAATRENGFAFSYLPRISGDHSHYPTMMRMIDGATKGFIVIGQNPVVGSANSRLQRKALASLQWLVVRDMNEIETASFWHDSPEIDAGEARAEQIATEVFFLPCAAHTEKDGSFTNTQRLLQWRFKALEPREDCRSDLWFTHQLGLRVREQLSGSKDPKDRPILDLTWDYRTQGPQREPGSTPASSPTARTRSHASGQEASRTGSPPSGAGRGPETAASSTTARPPAPTEGPGRSASATSGGTPSRESGRASAMKWTSSPRRLRTTCRRARRRAWMRSRGARPSSCIQKGSAGCMRHRGWLTARCRPTTSRTSRRSRTCCSRRARARRASASGERRTRTTRPTASREPTSSRSCSPPTA
jgi:formate dehydrogenase major subunit